MGTEINSLVKSYSLLVTDRVRSTREGNVFTCVCLSVCPQGGTILPGKEVGEGGTIVPSWGGVPCPGQGGILSWPGGVPCPSRGVPCPSQGGTLSQPGGYPVPATAGTLSQPGGTLSQPGGGYLVLAVGGYLIRQCTSYTTVGMPLAFTQEDFLVTRLSFCSMSFGRLLCSQTFKIDSRLIILGQARLSRDRAAISYT